MLILFRQLRRYNITQYVSNGQRGNRYMNTYIVSNKHYAYTIYIL